MFVLFLLFVFLPIVEIMVLINVSSSIGGWNTFFIVVITAFFGAYFVRQQGFALLQQTQSQLAQGKSPNDTLAQGLLLLVAGVLMITPGFITDILGFLFTLPFSRVPIARYLIKHVFSKHMQNAQFSQKRQHTHYSQDPSQDSSPFSSSRKHEQGDVIDGEYTDKTENDEKNRLN